MQASGSASRLSLSCVLLLAAAPAAAQLRPLEPAEWRVFEPGASLVAEVGAASYQQQRASLAGTEGSLRELGSFRAIWRTGRIALEASGTVLRLFTDDETFADPAGGALSDRGPRRRDSGDYRIATTVLLSPPDRPGALTLRFGTRLPTTDNEVGLERDRTDFFVLFGGALGRGRLRLAAETGLGINGTTDLSYEQADVWLYAASAQLATRWVTPSLSLVGQRNGRWSFRGTEDLSELRAGVRIGSRRWLRAEVVRGLVEFSPSAGVTVSAGVRR